MLTINFEMPVINDASFIKIDITDIQIRVELQLNVVMSTKICTGRNFHLNIFASILLLEIIGLC